MGDMENNKERTIFNSDVSLNSIFFIFACISTILLIMMRDITGISVNRYIFVVISLVSAIFMNIENCIAYLFFFDAAI